MTTRNKTRAVKQNGNGAPTVENNPPQARRMSVSQDTLDLLIQGHDALVQKRQQLAQQIQEVDGAIQKQVGGIQLMRNLLASQDEEDGADTELVDD